MLNIFDDDAFSLHSLTAAINELPEVPTLIGGLNIFEEEGIDTTIFSVEKEDDGLTLVASSPRGGPGETVGGETRNLTPIRVPHFERDDSVMADEVQNVRAFGTESTLETVQARVNKKMARHTRSFDFTNENLRVGAIKGVILDKDGSTLLDTYAAFGETPPTPVDFQLDQSTTDVRDKCRQVLDGMEDALEGDMVMQAWGIAGDDFFHQLVTHPAVEDTYKNWEAATDLRADPRRPFSFSGINWVRYHTRPKAKAAKAGNAMIGDLEARFVVSGVPDLFITRYAPADYEETVNTEGLPRYARQIPMRNGKGVELEMQTNVMHLCTRPQSLYSGTTP